MKSIGIYYTGRVLKLGMLTQEGLKEALLHPAVVNYRGNSWTFTNVIEYNQSGRHYIYGRLSKYSPDGEVGIVDEKTKSEITQDEPNLLVSSSPFVYIPEHSGIAFLHVPNQVEVSTFRRRFAEIVEASHQGFFVNCDIELISDLNTFASELRSLDGIFKLDSKVSPPNPLFGPLWKPIENYLRSRNTDRMAIVEDAPKGEFIRTALPEIVEKVAALTEDAPLEVEGELPIGDAAILMAADGYGQGIVRGSINGELVVIRTSETALNFSFTKSADPHELYERALVVFERIKSSRHMEHGT